MDPAATSTLPHRRVRHPVCLDARITRSDGSITHSVLCDLSLEGCCVTGRFPIGETLTVVMPRIGSLTGQVRWCLSNRTGIRFARQDGRGD